MQLFLCKVTGRPDRGKPNHSDLHLTSCGDWQAHANDDVVCVAALLKYIEAGIGLIGGERLRQARLVACERQLGEEYQVSTPGNRKLDEVQMLDSVCRHVARNGSVLDGADFHREIFELMFAKWKSRLLTRRITGWPETRQR